jgi:hypothetical protein
LRMLSRHRALRQFAAVLAAVALVGQVASFAHLVLVRHVTCAEHGELIEVGHERTIVATVAHKNVAAVNATSPREVHGHDHCLLAPLRRDRAALGAPTSLDALHVDAYGTIGHVANREIPPPIAVLLLAPKSSPPTV